MPCFFTIKHSYYDFACQGKADNSLLFHRVFNFCIVSLFYKYLLFDMSTYNSEASRKSTYH